MSREKIMSYLHICDEIAVHDTIEWLVHINKIDYRGSGNDRSY